MEKKEERQYSFISNEMIAREFTTSFYPDEVLNKYGITRAQIEYAEYLDYPERHIEEMLASALDVEEDGVKGKNYLSQVSHFEDGILRKATSYSWHGGMFRTAFFDDEKRLHNEDGPALFFLKQQKERYFIHGVELAKEEFEEQRMLKEIPINNIPNKKPISF